MKAAEGSGILIIIPVGNPTGILLKKAYVFQGAQNNFNVIFFSMVKVEITNFSRNSSKNIEADDSGIVLSNKQNFLIKKNEMVANLS